MNWGKKEILKISCSECGYLSIRVVYSINWDEGNGRLVKG